MFSMFYTAKRLWVLFKNVQSAGGGFPIWGAVAKPPGEDAGAGGLHPCGGIKAIGLRSKTAHQFPCFGAVAPRQT